MYQQPPYQQSPQGYPYPPRMSPMLPDSRKGQAITGFVLGLIGILLMFFSWTGLGPLDFILTVLGVVFSSLGLKSTTSRGLAIAGLVLSIIALVIVGFVVLAALSILSAFSHL